MQIPDNHVTFVKLYEVNVCTMQKRASKRIKNSQTLNKTTHMYTVNTQHTPAQISAYSKYRSS